MDACDIFVWLQYPFFKRRWFLFWPKIIPNVLKKACACTGQTRHHQPW